MSAPSIPVMTLFRAHRGLWTVFLLALLTTSTFGSACLASELFRDSVTAVASSTADTAPMPAANVSINVDNADSWHFASGDDHDSYQDSPSLSADKPSLAVLPHSLTFLSNRYTGRVPDLPGSILRPPIA